MKKFIRKVVKSFKKLTDSGLLAFGHNVTTCMAEAIAIFPTPVPSLASINTQLASYEELIQTSASRDKVQVWLKNQCRFELQVMLSQLADYVNATTSNAADLAQTGFNLNKEPAPITLEPPTGLVLTDGPNSGDITLRFKKVKGASSYVHQYTTDATLPDESWVSNPSTTSHFTFKGLTRGTTYYVRTIAVGSNQQTVQSNIVNRVSQ